MPPLEIFAVEFEDGPKLLNRPRVDCGLTIGCFCDFCRAKDREPREQWAAGQVTPLCTRCDRTHDMRHYCRGQSWCAPPTTERRQDGAGDANFIDVHLAQGTDSDCS